MKSDKPMPYWCTACRTYLGVNEATFRLDEGDSEVDTIDGMESLVRGTSGKKLTYRDSVA